jgi:hypothetical protein
VMNQRGSLREFEVMIMEITPNIWIIGMQKFVEKYLVL